jgi:hypothetical protein
VLAAQLRARKFGVEVKTGLNNLGRHDFAIARLGPYFITDLPLHVIQRGIDRGANF